MYLASMLEYMVPSPGCLKGFVKVEEDNFQYDHDLLGLGLRCSVFRQHHGGTDWAFPTGDSSTSSSACSGWRSSLHELPFYKPSTRKEEYGASHCGSSVMTKSVACGLCGMHLMYSHLHWQIYSKTGSSGAREADEV